MTLIKYRANAEEANMGGRTIAEVRRAYEGVFGIPADATALVNNTQAGPEHHIADGDKVEFVKSETKFA